MQTDDGLPRLESLKPISDFAARLGIDPATIYRWVTIGVNPGRLKLRAWRLHVWCTTDECFAEFINARTAATIEAAAVEVPSPVAMSKGHKAAVEKLRKAGFNIPGSPLPADIKCREQATPSTTPPEKTPVKPKKNAKPKL